MISIPSSILDFKGQCVNGFEFNSQTNKITIILRRDQRYSPVDPVTGKKGSIKKIVPRQVRDTPLFGTETWLSVERAQVRTSGNQRRMEAISFCDEGCYYTQRFCRLVNGLCRHMSIHAVSSHLNIRWDTVKNMDKYWLYRNLAALKPEEIKELAYLGVDEVARAKGHDYMTVIYDMKEGHLIGVETGRKADVLIDFLKRLPESTRAQIKAVAMDMGLSYQKAVREVLPHADIVFDRFHVMLNYSKAVKNQRRVEFRKADSEGKDLIKGSLYLLLRNADKLSEKQALNLKALLDNNSNMNILYCLKEQLQAMWREPTFEAMQAALEAWCKAAEQTNMTYLKKFAKMLRRHRDGICNYAKHRLTSARIEAGNVAIGMIRKRARGIKDTEYFKLKIRQTAVPDDGAMFYQQ